MAGTAVTAEAGTMTIAVTMGAAIVVGVAITTDGAAIDSFV